MAIKKSELYSSLWQSCDDLRGSMDASQYKDYILTLLFVKYVSDKYAGKKRGAFRIPEGGSFQDMVAQIGKKDIGEQIDKIIGKLAQVNDLQGVIDITAFNNPDKLGKGQVMQDRLSNLIRIFNDENLNFSRNRADDDDILGDAYEFLMGHFATESGKSKGQFYTPAEVSRIVAKVIGVNENTTATQTVYDPTCGSGSLLLKVADEALHKMSIYGQEMDMSTRGLAKMNTILHNHPTAVIAPPDNTLAHPFFKNKHGGLETFDFAVANPPFSAKSWTQGLTPADDDYNRFTGYGIPPEKNGDYAFLLHLLKSLKSNGKGAIILPHGVLFRGNAEATIRANLIQKGYIKGIIGLPANLFYGTGIPACIIVIDKENAVGRKGIFMLDASKAYLKDGNKNRLRERDIHKIVDVFNKLLEVPHYARMVSLDEVAANDYNLNLPRYIDNQDQEDQQDIASHLQGGIPNADIEALQAYWTVYPGLKRQLFKSAERQGYSALVIAEDGIKNGIYQHSEFISYQHKIKQVFENWRKEHSQRLKALTQNAKPKKVIYELSESLLTAFSDRPLLDNYAIYQYLMDYWQAVMKDDVYFISEEGWKVELKRILNKRGTTVVDVVCELIPKNLMIDRYFPQEQAAIDDFEQKKVVVVAELQALQEDITEQQALQKEDSEQEEDSEEANDDGKLSRARITARLKEKIEANERALLKQYLTGLDKETKLSVEIRAATEVLNNQVLEKYPQLSEAEIKVLLVDDKWMAQIESDIQAELKSLAQNLSRRIKTLAQRYAEPLPQLQNDVESLAGKVEARGVKKSV